MMQPKSKQSNSIRTNLGVAGLSRLASTASMVAVVGALAMGSMQVAHAQAQTTGKDAEASATDQVGTKIGFVNTQRILSDSEPAKQAQAKIEAEFDKRNQELQKSIDKFREDALKFEKDAPVMAESERNRRQRELGNVDSDLQRKQREIQEDFNRRRNEEFSDIIEDANLAIKNIAEEEEYDLIIQDAVTVSPRVDITDKVLEALAKQK